MGFGQNFLRNMSRRSYQYAVRSAYPLFEKNRSTRTRTTKYKSELDSYNTKIPKYTPPPCDKNGISYCGQSKVIFQNKTYSIEEITGKMVILSDGKRHRLSSCEFI